MNACDHARGPPLAPDELWCAKPSTNYSLRWFRGSCHELSCQLSRTIVPVATNYRANCHGSLQKAGATFIFRWVMVSSDENGGRKMAALKADTVMDNRAMSYWLLCKGCSIASNSKQMISDFSHREPMENTRRAGLPFWEYIGNSPNSVVLLSIP